MNKQALRKSLLDNIDGHLQIINFYYPFKEVGDLSELSVAELESLENKLAEESERREPQNNCC